MRAWIARDRNGNVHVYLYIKPEKGRNLWKALAEAYFLPDIYIPECVNPQWSDDEPIEVELKLEKI